MDMYQKRKMRQKNKKEDNQKSLQSTSINCLMKIYSRNFANPYIIWKNMN